MIALSIARPLTKMNCCVAARPAHSRLPDEASHRALSHAGRLDLDQAGKQLVPEQITNPIAQMQSSRGVEIPPVIADERKRHLPDGRIAWRYS